MQRHAIYPGSFDPPTLGHLDIIKRAARMFESLIVGVGANSSKQGFLSVEERVEALEACVVDLPNVKVQSFQGLLVDFAKEQGVEVIVRGLRATADFEYEFQMAMVNRKLAPQVETMFLMTKWEYSFVSSSMVREVALLEGNFTELVPGPVEKIVSRVLSRRHKNVQ